MNFRLCLAALAFAAYAGIASAAVFHTDDFTIDVPEGFEGPISRAMGSEAKVVAFTKPHTGRSTSTLLLGMTYRFSGGLQAIPHEQLGAVADKYVLEFLAGVERRRQNFSSSPPARVEIDGMPSSRLTWTGSAGGKLAHGIMYCTVVGAHIVVFHTQDLDDAPPSNMQQAEAAIKMVRFSHAASQEAPSKYVESP